MNSLSKSNGFRESIFEDRSVNQNIERISIPTEMHACVLNRNRVISLGIQLQILAPKVIRKKNQK